MELKIKRVNEDAFLPVRMNPTDAGADLISPVEVMIIPNDHVLIDLGFQMELPKGTVGYIYARSGLATKFGVRPRNCVGVIDEKYRGNVMVMLENASDKPVVVEKGDRIAQLVVQPIFTPEVIECDELDMDGDRQGGFGSTGR